MKNIIYYTILIVIIGCQRQDNTKVNNKKDFPRSYQTEIKDSIILNEIKKYMLATKEYVDNNFCYKISFKNNYFQSEIFLEYMNKNDAKILHPDYYSFVNNKLVLLYLSRLYGDDIIENINVYNELIEIDSTFSNSNNIFYTVLIRRKIIKCFNEENGYKVVEYNTFEEQFYDDMNESNCFCRRKIEEIKCNE